MYWRRFTKQTCSYIQQNVLSENGISASADKVKAVKSYPTPRSAKEVRAFLGPASFYRRLVPNFAEAAKPLTKLTRKTKSSYGGRVSKKRLKILKIKLCTTPVLAYPNFDLPFILTTDASKVAVAAILSQEQDGIERPIAYASMQLVRLSKHILRQNQKFRNAGPSLGDKVFQMLSLWCQICG